MKNIRCEEVILQLVVRTYDDQGRPVHEQVSGQMKVFRNAETRDFWGGVVDKTVAAALQKQPAPQAPPPAAPLAAVPAKKRSRG